MRVCVYQYPHRILHVAFDLFGQRAISVAEMTRRKKSRHDPVVCRAIPFDRFFGDLGARMFDSVRLNWIDVHLFRATQRVRENVNQSDNMRWTRLLRPPVA